MISQKFCGGLISIPITYYYFHLQDQRVSWVSREQVNFYQATEHPIPHDSDLYMPCVRTWNFVYIDKCSRWLFRRNTSLININTSVNIFTGWNRQWMDVLTKMYNKNLKPMTAPCEGKKDVLWWGSWNLQNLHYLRISLLSDKMQEPVSLQCIKLYSRSIAVRIHHRMWTSLYRFARHVEGFLYNGSTRGCGKWAS
jgi:hypothetical protein